MISHFRELECVCASQFTGFSNPLIDLSFLAHCHILLLENFVLVHLLGLFFPLHVLCFVVYASFSVALSQGDASKDLSETITPLTLKKKGALAPQETYDNDADDNSPTHPPASSQDVYLEDM